MKKIKMFLYLKGRKKRVKKIVAKKENYHNNQMKKIIIKKF